MIELLVVIGIMILLMSLTAASVVRQPRLSRILGAEQVIGDAIRQARHTARSTGQPVVLMLNRNTGEIAGLVRTTLWSGTEGWPQPTDPAAPHAPFDMPGRTGSGLYLRSDAYGAYGDPASPDLAQKIAALPGMPLEKNRLLMRGTGSVPGLLLTVWVRPPMAADSPSVFLPLAMVGEDKPVTDAEFGAQDLSAFGLALWRVDPGLATNPANVAAHTTMPDGRDGPPVKCWDICGWLDDGASVVQISAIDQHQLVKDHLSRDEVTRSGLLVANDPSAVAVTDIAAPLYGGAWVEVGLLFDGARLVLYRDGRRVAETACTPSHLRSIGTAQRVFVGAAQPPQAPHALTNLAVAAGATIDDVRLERLGQSMSGRLPSGVMSNRDCRITCHPDGRVEVNAAGNALASEAVGANAITVSGVGAAGGEQATIEISFDGTVSSTMLASRPVTPP